MCGACYTRDGKSIRRFVKEQEKEWKRQHKEMVFHEHGCWFWTPTIYPFLKMRVDYMIVDFDGAYMVFVGRKHTGPHWLTFEGAKKFCKNDWAERVKKAEKSGEEKTLVEKIKEMRREIYRLLYGIRYRKIIGEQRYMSCESSIQTNERIR